jgi:hypothetical protein
MPNLTFAYLTYINNSKPGQCLQPRPGSNSNHEEMKSMARAETDNSTSELKLVAPRRNFLIRALGFTAAGAILPIGIVTAEDARSRIAHHQAELEKAWGDYYGAANVRTFTDVRPQGATYTSYGKEWPALSGFMICASEGPGCDWAIESHARKCEQPRHAVEELQRRVDAQMAKSFA